MHVGLVYLQWFRRSWLLKSVSQPKIAKNWLKPLFWGSRSFKVIDVGTPGKLVSSACYDKLFIYNSSHARRANRGKIAISYGCTPLWCPRSFEGNFLTQRYEICSQETRDSRLLYAKNPQSLSHLGLNRYRVVSDEQMDRITESRTKSPRTKSPPVIGRSRTCISWNKIFHDIAPACDRMCLRTWRRTRGLWWSKLSS